MKKVFVIVIMTAPITLQFCSSSKNMAKAKATQTSYSAHVKPIMLANCSPCHFPPKGNKKAYDNYLAVKGDINAILDRINRNPGDKGFMPFKHAKLPDSTINVFVKWKKEGLLEN